MIQYALHRAEPADFPLAYALFRECWEPIKIARDGLWREAIENPFRLKDFTENGVDIITADAQPVGIVCVSNNPDELYLREMSLISDYQSKGIGTQIINHLKETATDLGKPFTLHVHKLNSRAHKLYAAQSFNVIGENEKGTHYKMQWLPENNL